MGIDTSRYQGYNYVLFQDLKTGKKVMDFVFSDSDIENGIMSKELSKKVDRIVDSQYVWLKSYHDLCKWYFNKSTTPPYRGWSL